MPQPKPFGRAGLRLARISEGTLRLRSGAAACSQLIRACLQKHRPNRPTWSELRWIILGNTRLKPLLLNVWVLSTVTDLCFASFRLRIFVSSRLVSTQLETWVSSVFRGYKVLYKVLMLNKHFDELCVWVQLYDGGRRHTTKTRNKPVSSYLHFCWPLCTGLFIRRKVKGIKVNPTVK